MCGNKKVAMFLPHVLPHYGGTEIATFSLARELRAQALCDVNVWAFCEHLNDKRFETKGEANNSFYAEQMADVPVFRYPIIGLPKIKDFSIKLMMDLKNSDEDILHFQGAHRPLSRLLIKKIVKNKITILTTHTLQESVTYIERKKLRFLIYPLYLASLRNLDHIIALTQRDVNLLVSMGLKRERITLIPNGLDESKFRKRRSFVNKNGKLKILCVAQFNPNKNFEAVIQVVDKLSKTFDLEAYIIGAPTDQEYLNNIIQLVKDKNLEKIVRIGVSIDNAALVDCYLSCDLFIFLSRVETSPLVILEAMYAGLPIVATKVGSIPEIVKNGVNGFLVSPDNIQQICDCMSKLLKDSTFRKDISMRNKQIAKGYTWSKVALTTDDLYQRLVEEHQKIRLRCYS
jgi:glycosyltransferase involved in cell wall biosynthesis